MIINNSWPNCQSEHDPADNRFFFRPDCDWVENAHDLIQHSPGHETLSYNAAGRARTEVEILDSCTINFKLGNCEETFHGYPKQQLAKHQSLVLIRWHKNTLWEFAYLKNVHKQNRWKIRGDILYFLSDHFIFQVIVLVINKLER